LKVFRSGYVAGTHYLTSFPSVTSQDVGYNSITGPIYTNGVVSWTLNNVPLLLDPSATDYTLRRIGVVNNLYGGYSHDLSYVGKLAGFISALNVIPFVDPAVGVVIFAAASILKDTVNRVGDLLDDGKVNQSFKS